MNVTCWRCCAARPRRGATMPSSACCASRGCRWKKPWPPSNWRVCPLRHPPAGGAAAGGGLPGQSGERAGLRQSRQRQDPPALRHRFGTDAPGPARAVRKLQPAGAGVAGGQGRTETSSNTAAPGPVRGARNRRYRVCAAEPPRRWRCSSRCWRTATNAPA